MSSNIKEFIESYNLEQDIKKAKVLVKKGFFVEELVVSLDDTYQEIQAESKLSGFNSYLKDNKIVFAKSIDIDASSSFQVLVPNDYTKEEYELIAELSKTKVFTIFEIIFIILMFVFFGLFVLSFLNSMSDDLEGMIQSLISMEYISYIFLTLLSFIGFVITKGIKKLL